MKHGQTKVVSQVNKDRTKGLVPFIEDSVRDESYDVNRKMTLDDLHAISKRFDKLKPDPNPTTALIHFPEGMAKIDGDSYYIAIDYNEEEMTYEWEEVSKEDFMELFKLK